MTELIMAPISISTHEAILSSDHGTTRPHIKSMYTPKYEFILYGLSNLFLDEYDSNHTSYGAAVMQQPHSHCFANPTLQRYCTEKKDQALGGGRT
jgi:hypothetical protein